MIVIPMAGESRRFREDYKLPKYMLPVSERPLFDWVLLSFQAYFRSENFLFIARDVHQTRLFIEDRIQYLGLERAQIVMLDSLTGGQAETVEHGLLEAGVAGETEISIFNIDTIRPQIDLRPEPDASGWVEVFSAPGENWSFVEPDPHNQNLMRRCVEKERISDLCCTGLYNFTRVDLFMSALSKERANPSMNELYIAPLYNHLIRDGFTFGWRRTPTEKIIPSGVPTEYECLKNKGLHIDMF